MRNLVLSTVNYPDSTPKRRKFFLLRLMDLDSFTYVSMFGAQVCNLLIQHLLDYADKIADNKINEFREMSQNRRIHFWYFHTSGNTEEGFCISVWTVRSTQGRGFPLGEKGNRCALQILWLSAKHPTAKKPLSNLPRTYSISTHLRDDPAFSEFFSTFFIPFFPSLSFHLPLSHSSALPVVFPTLNPLNVFLLPLYLQVRSSRRETLFIASTFWIFESVDTEKETRYATSIVRKLY